MARVKLSLPPCADCLHRPVCGRYPALATFGNELHVESNTLPAGLVLTLSASVECDAYLPPGMTRDAPVSVALLPKKRHISEAGREAIRAAAIRRRERERAERVAAGGEA